MSLRKTAALLAALVVSSLAFPVLAAEAAKPAAPAPATGPVYREFVEGNPKAKVTVIEYASVTCPHCARFYLDSYPDLKKNYIDTGKIRFVFRDFPTAPVPLAMAAAGLARCAPGDRGKTLIEMMFKNQQEWMQAPNETLRGYAQLAGMSSEDVDDCLKNQAILKEIQDVQEKAVTLYKVQSTPSFFVGEELVQGNDYETLKRVIDKHL